MSDKFKKLINSDSGKISKDILELSLDSFIENETLKEIPIFGTIVNLYNLGSTINDKIFANKLIHFLKELEDINPEIIQKEIQYIDDSKEYSHKVGDKILEIINRIDSEEKPKIIGRLFKNFIDGKINYNDFLRLSFIVDKLYIDSLKHIINYNFNLEPFILITPELKDLFLYNICIKRYNPNYIYMEQEWVEFRRKNAKLTDLGKKLVDFGLK